MGCTIVRTEKKYGDEEAGGSPGVVLSANLLQVPVDVPVNASGNTVNVIALLNPSFGTTRVNA